MPSFQLVNPKAQNVGEPGSEGYFDATVNAKTSSQAAKKLFGRMANYINNENDAMMLFSIQKVDSDGALVGNPMHFKGVKSYGQKGGGIGFFSDTEEQFEHTSSVKVTKYKIPKNLNMQEGGMMMEGGGFSSTFDGSSSMMASSSVGGGMFSSSIGGSPVKKKKDNSMMNVYYPFWYYDTLWYNWPWYTSYIYDYNLYYTNLFRALTPISALADVNSLQALLN